MSFGCSAALNRARTERHLCGAQANIERYITEAALQIEVLTPAAVSEMLQLTSEPIKPAGRKRVQVRRIIAQW